MIENRQKEWSELEQNAVQMLDNFDLLPKESILKFYRPTLRLWIYPSFDFYKVWNFCEPNFKTTQPKNLKIVRASWNQNEDYQRLSDPIEGLKKGFETTPKIEVESIDFERESFEQLLSDLQKISFSAFANYKNSIGIDGVRHGIETFDFTHKTSISWWSIYPKEWQDLVEWFEKTINYLETEFAKR
jgi:hypothetical protein